MDLLACGPYFQPGGIVSSIVIFLLIKPLTYFAFVQSFRYRVSRDVPMSFRQAAKLAALRALLGLVFIGGGAFLLANYGRYGEAIIASWVYMYAARLFSWWLVGRHVAKITGRRLAGWIVGGMVLNAAFDAAVVAGLMAGVLPATGVVLVISLFILILHNLGQRASLQARFSGYPECRSCEYNLTGNLSGVCPECGTVIASAPA